MQLILRVASAVLLVQSVVAFKPAQVPRKIVQLNSLIDEAYDVPSIAQSYSRAAAEVATKVSDVAKGIPKVAKGMPEYDVSEVASKAQSATTEASAKVFSEASAQVSSAVDEFVKAANQNFPAVKSTVSTGLNSAFFKPLLSPLDPSNFPKISPVHPLEAGKAHTLIDYFREKVEDGSFSMKVPDAGTMSDAKSKFALMVSNTYELFGQNAPQTIPALPDGSAGWIATAVVSVVAIGQRNAGVAEAKAAMGDMVKKEASAVSEIAEQLVSKVL
jgi:methyl-accepting chemotaxis protein